jgi:hypothetical protein
MVLDDMDEEFTSDDDDDEDKFVLHALLLLLSLHSSNIQLGINNFSESSTPVPRAPSFFDQRLLWNDVLHSHGNRCNFTRHLRMSSESFHKLLSYVSDALTVNHEMASLRGGAVMPELCLYLTLRWLAGGSYSDIYMFAGISPASFYRLLWKTIAALVACPRLKIKFPRTQQECEVAANGFESISTGGAITNCVAAADGYLQEILTPPLDRAGNQRTYFSGHYQRQGVNV